MRSGVKNGLGWFLFGLGSSLQLFGTSLSFTELFIFCAAPLLMANEIPYLRKNGMMPLFTMSIAVVVGGAVSCIVNRSPMFAVIRGMAVVCALPCTIVVCHWMLRRNMDGFKWWLLGAMLSGFLCTFVFRRAVEVSMNAGGVIDANTTAAIMSGPTYWIQRLGAFITTPAKMWYLRFPTLYSAGAPLFMAGFSLLTSASGRSAALGSLAGAAIIVLGRKKQSSMKRIGRYFWVLFVAAIVGAFVVKNVYRYAAINNWLGDESRKKYERQTKGKTGMMALLMGGRMESFCGLIACIDKPIIGFGPWARDYHGYTAEFLEKYADYEDVQRYYEMKAKDGGMIGLIPCHAIITEFWLWYGIFGLVFWLYVIFVLIRFLRQDCWAVPQWYMWLAATIPSYFWGIFFSPWSGRVNGVLFIVACLMARAVRRGRQRLPMEMVMEIVKTERK